MGLLAGLGNGLFALGPGLGEENNDCQRLGSVGVLIVLLLFLGVMVVAL